MKILKLKVELLRLELIESLSKVCYNYEDCEPPYIFIFDNNNPIISIDYGFIYTETDKVLLSDCDIETLLDVLDCMV